MGSQLVQEGAVRVGVGHDVVEADAAAHEHLLHPGQAPQLAQEACVVTVVGLERRAGLRAQAAAVDAGAPGALLGAGRSAEVRRGTAHIVDVALEVGLGGHGAGLFQKRLVGAARDDAPLMESECAEGAFAEATATGSEGELHLGKGRHAAGLVVGRVPRAGVGQPVDGVHLILGQRGSGRILHHVHAVGIGLHQPPSLHRIARAVLDGKALREGALAGRCLLPTRQHLVVHHMIQRASAVHRAVDEGEVLHRKTGGERIGDLHDGALPHAVGDEVGARIHEDRAFERVGPVVIVSQAAQARFDAA